MAEFKLGRIRFVWKDQWTTGTTYYKDDIVAYGGKTYLCVVGHTAAADFYTDVDNLPTRWNLFADGTQWKGDWTNGPTVYKENDIVKYGGYVYICKNGHTTQATLELSQSNWDLFAEGLNWTNNWATGTTYKVNDLVKYGGYVYTAKTAHTSAATVALGLEADQSKWDLFSKGFDWKGAWTTGARYKVGDLIKYGGTTYVCNQYHTSAATVALGLEADQSKWDYFNQGLDYKGTWVTATRYKVNDVVKNGGGTFICVTNHTASADFSTDNARWNTFVEGVQFDGDWSGSSTTYQSGDIIRYGGNSYFSKTNHISSAGSPPPTNTTDWALFSQGFRVAGDWLVGTAYKIGEVVRNGGFTYVAAADSTGQKPPNVTYWTKLNEGIKWKGTWATSTTYELGDSVKYGPISYICIAGHSSSSGNRPDTDISGTYWNLLTSGNENDVLTTTGDLVYYGGAGATRLPVGVEGQVLTVRSGLPSWTYFGRVSKVFYVGPNGTNSPAPTYGLTVDQPWASVRYGLEQIREGTENPNAKYLLDQNRAFIQKEVVEWMDYQKTNNIAPFTSGSTYDKAKSQRDTGLVLDAVLYDLTHTGNEKSVASARSFFTALGVSYLPSPELCAAALNYMKTLVGNVLANTAPSSNYQALNGISAPNRILQIINGSYTAESTANATCTTLATIVTDAITAGNTNSLPVLDSPNVTLFVKTGQFYEVLPMIIPAGVSVVGDELRSTRVSPAGKITSTNDKAKSVAALTRLQAITANIITNTSVTPTTGNSATQYTALQKAGNVGSATAVTSVNNNITEIKNIINTGTVSSFVYPDPSGYGSGFSNARRLILANKAFIQAEVSAFVPFTYGTSVTSIDGTGELFNTGTAHGLTAGAKVGFSSTQGGVTQGVTYYVLAAGLTTTAFKVASTSTSSTPVDLTTVASPSPVMKVFAYDAATCVRDIGYEIDGLVYDLTYGETSGCNLATQITARSYYSAGVFVEPSTEKTAALGTQARIKAIISFIAQGNTASWTKTAGNAATQDVSGTAGSSTAGSFAQDRVQEVYDTINTGTTPTTIAPSTAWVATALVTSRTLLVAKKTAIKNSTTSYIDTQYPTLVYNKTTCDRDVGYVIDNLGYDLMFGSNYLSILSGRAYRRATTSAAYVLANQKQATLDTWTYLGVKAAYVVAGGATVLADKLWTDIIAYVNTGTRPIVVGDNSPSEDTDLINGAKILALNTAFMQAEATAYINNTYKSTVTASTGGATDTYTCGTQTWMVAGDAVRFTGTPFGGVSTGVTYYILASGLTSTSFKVALTPGGTAVDLSNASGSMTVTYYYSAARCQNDVKNYIEAIVYDMVYTGNYKSVLAARYYRNALTGSKLEDMYYVRNGCGLRNQTTTGLDGTSDGNTAGAGTASGFTAANAYGTKRPLAGAYVSLDPGWGPQDERVWVSSKSTYVQNVTTFGTACVGQKIDGSLHAGGNDSIVSNDFTQVLSDGIGAWVLNLGRAELVSVFTYYNYIGYLAENGGKIRATNGNNSYGSFGSVSEYIDVTETPVTGFVNNRASPANIANVIVDGNNILAMEYANAGTAYYNATYAISGSGTGALTRENEFRDGSVYQVRMVDPGDSTGGGGANYLTQSNTGQGGSATAISLAVSDQQSSAAYVGMSVYITAGTGAGQYANIITYNAGSKLATVTKDSFVPLTVTATAITTNLVTVSSFTTLTTGQAITLDTAIGGLSAAPTIYYVLDVPVSTQIPIATVARSVTLATVVTSVPHGMATGHTVSIQYTGTQLDGDSAKVITKVDATTFTYTSSTSGTITQVAATSGKVAPDSKITVKTTPAGSTAATLSTATGTSTLYAAGWDHIVSGTAIQSSLSITSNYVITPRLSFTAPTYTTASVSMASSQNWNDIAYGDGYGSYTGVSATGGAGSLATFDIIRRNGVYAVTLNVPGVLYAAGNTLTVLGTSLGGTVANNLTITINTVNSPSGSIATFTATGTAVTPKIVAVAGGGTNVGGYSTDGGTTWTASTLPASGNWIGVAYGVVANVGYYVAVMNNSGNTAWSTDGITWTASSIGTSALWTDVAYGNGRFVIVSQKTTGTAYRAHSVNGGQSWTAGTLTVNIDAAAVAYGNNRFVTVETAAAGSTNALYSTDGITWVSMTLPSTSNWVDVTYGNGKFVAISSTSMGNTAYVIDGSTTWVGGQLPAYTDWAGVHYSNGVFFAHGRGANATVGVAASSQDGINWIQRDVTTASLTVTSTAKDTNPGSYTARTLPSTAYWTDVMWSGAQFVAIGHDNASVAYAAYSANGQTWNAGTLPNVSGAYTYSAIAWNGSNQYIAVIQDTRHIATSTDGITFVGTINALPTTGSWADMVYGGGKYVMVSSAQNRTSYSTDGVNWTTGSISASATEYTGIAYGLLGATAYYVVTAGLTGTSQVSAYSTDGITWTAGSQMPSADLWSSVAYGNSRFVAVAGNATTTTTKAAYSTAAGTWVAATMPGAAARWNKITFGGGAFTAFAYNSTRTAYSTDGITWVEGPTLPTTRNWTAAAYGSSTYVALATGGTNGSASINFLLDTNLLSCSVAATSGLDVGDPIKFTSPIGTLNNYTTYYVTSVFSSTQFTVSTTRGGSNTVMSTASGSMPASASKFWTSSMTARGSTFVATPKMLLIGSGTQKQLLVTPGATTKARAYVSGAKLSTVWINEPGSFYAAAPTMTIVDPNNTGSDAPVTVRIGNGALAQPNYSSRGTNYTASTASITGDGYADNYQIGNYIAMTGLTSIPVAGSNVQIAGIDKIWYRLVTVTAIAQSATTGLYSAQLQVSPKFGVAESPEHLTATTIRRRYSQVRLTGHDFLSIGTGNVITTNYPGTPIYDATPATETKNYGGGRVFYTSTDQDGNFRVGGLFNVEQSTGVATLNADAFNIAGLNELSLGSVALGGTGAKITEFSTDPYFTQNSDAVVPTQRAIKAYITSQIGGGGSQLNVNTLTAGVVYIAGQTITTTTNVAININTKVNFKGGITGDALVLNYFLQNN